MIGIEVGSSRAACLPGVNSSNKGKVGGGLLLLIRVFVLLGFTVRLGFVRM